MLGRLLAAGALSVVLVGCSAGDDVKVADAAVAGFHREMNAQAFDAVWAASSPRFKAHTTAAAMTRLLSAVHRKLGAYTSGARVGWSVNYGTAGHIATVGHAARYERGAATERFSFLIKDHRASLVGYNINSDALIEN